MVYQKNSAALIAAQTRVHQVTPEISPCHRRIWQVVITLSNLPRLIVPVAVHVVGSPKGRARLHGCKSGFRIHLPSLSVGSVLQINDELVYSSVAEIFSWIIACVYVLCYTNTHTYTDAHTHRPIYRRV